MLTPKQYKLLMFIDNSIKENGCCPSFEEMKQAVGIKSKSGIHALIEGADRTRLHQKAAAQGPRA